MPSSLLVGESLPAQEPLVKEEVEETPKEELQETLEKAPENPSKESGDESSGPENTRPREPKGKERAVPAFAMAGHLFPMANTLLPATSRPVAPEPSQEYVPPLRLGGLFLPGGNPMQQGVPQQAVAGPSTPRNQVSQPPKLSEAEKLEKLKQKLMRARNKPPQLFHDKKGKAPSTPHGTRAMGSAERDQELKSSEKLESLNRQYSAEGAQSPSSPTEGRRNAEQRPGIRMIPIATLRAMQAAEDDEKEDSPDEMQE